MTAPFVQSLARDEGEHFHFLNSLMTTKVDGDTSEGRVTAMEFLAPRGFSPPLHRHDLEDELFHVIEGEVRFVAGDADVTHGPGGTVWAPRGLAHQFQVLSESARVFQVTTPAQFEEFVAKLGQRTDDPSIPEPVEIDGAHVAKICAEFDIAVLGPPMALPD